MLKATDGNTTRNTGEMRLMGTGRLQINSADKGLAAKVVGRPVLAQELARVEARELVPAQVEAPELAQAVAPELALVQGVAELELAQVAALLERDLVAVELELVPVLAVQEHAQVEAAPERDPVAARLKIKSAIAAHRRDLARLLAAADLAAVVESTREPAATEAATAWAAAV